MSDDYFALVAQLSEARKRIAELEEDLLLTQVWAELEISELRESAPPKLSKRSRTTDRTEVFVAACRRAKTPDNARSILNALIELAGPNRVFPQLLGYDPHSKEFKWDDGLGSVVPQSKRAALATISRLLEKRKSR